MKINKKSFVLTMVVAAGIAAVATTKVRASADTQLLALMPPDSQILIGGRIDQAALSPVGQFLLTKLPVSGPDELKAKTGFDVRTDLREAITSPVAKLVALRGTFPIARLEDLLQQGNHTVYYYQGFKTIGNSSDSASAAFLDGSTFIIGAPDAVHKAIDRWIAHTPPPDNDMTAKVAEVSATSQGWLAVTNMSVLQNLMGQPQNPQAAIMANVLQKITAVSGQFTLPPAGGVSLQGQVRATSPEDAQTLVDAFNALKLLAPPEATNKPVFSALQVSVNGSSINSSVALTEQQVETFLNRPGF